MLSGIDLISNFSDDGTEGTSQAQMEKLLLDNLSSEEDMPSPIHQQPQKKKQRREADQVGGEEFDPSSMFAAAEEFAHLLEEPSSGTKESKYNSRRQSGRTPFCRKKKRK